MVLDSIYTNSWCNVFSTILCICSWTCARLVIPALSCVLCVPAPYDLQIKQWPKLNLCFESIFLSLIPPWGVNPENLQKLNEGVLSFSHDCAWRTAFLQLNQVSSWNYLNNQYCICCSFQRFLQSVRFHLFCVEVVSVKVKVFNIS